MRITIYIIYVYDDVDVSAYEHVCVDGCVNDNDSCYCMCI
nr:MAG TPA: hypothetical protein [Caudoviricetes sp.]